MKKHAATPLLVLAVLTASAIGSLRAAPSEQTFFTNFDSGNVTTLGTAPNTATFENGSVGTLAIFRLYQSGSFAWMVTEGTTGMITFSTPASVVEFYVGAQTAGDGVLRVFDGEGNEIANKTNLLTDISGSAAFESYTHENGIGRIEIENLSGNGTSRIVVDDFGFTPGVASDAPEFAVQPQTTAVGEGERVQFFSLATADSEVTYQWRRDGQPIAGETRSFLVIDSAQTSDEGEYDVVATADGAEATSNPAELVVDDSREANFVNLSSRAEVEPGAKTLIPGFAIGGTKARTVLVRAVGPGLEEFDVEGFLADPTIALFSGNSSILFNDNWADENAAEIAAAAELMGAFPLVEGSRDAAFIATVNPGPLSVVVSSADGGDGIALVEVYMLPDE